MHTVITLGMKGQQRPGGNLNVFCVFVGKQHTVFKWKDAISRFPVSQGSAEALDRWGGKRKRHLISYFLINTSAKCYCYHNRIVYVKIIASQRRDVFFRHNVVKPILERCNPWPQYKHMHLYCSASAAGWLTTPTVTRHRPAHHSNWPASHTHHRQPCVTHTCDLNNSSRFKLNSTITVLTR